MSHLFLALGNFGDNFAIKFLIRMLLGLGSGTSLDGAGVAGCDLGVELGVVVPIGHLEWFLVCGKGVCAGED